MHSQGEIVAELLLLDLLDLMCRMRSLQKVPSVCLTRKATLHKPHFLLLPSHPLARLC